MSNYIKLFIISLGIVFISTIIIIFAVPGIRTKIFPDKKIEEEKIVESVKPDDVIMMEKRTLSSKQIFELAKELKVREEHIKNQEERILRMKDSMEKEKEEIIKSREEIEKMHKEIAEFIPLVSEGEKKNLKKLAKMFETLSSEAANPIMSDMPDQTLVIVLSYMKPRSSAKLLSGYAALSGESAKRSADLAEKLKKLVVK